MSETKESAFICICICINVVIDIIMAVLYNIILLNYILKKSQLDTKLLIRIKRFIEGSYLSSKRYSPESERIENDPLAIFISNELFNSTLVLVSSGINVHRFGTFLSTVLFAHSARYWHEAPLQQRIKLTSNGEM